MTQAKKRRRGRPRKITKKHIQKLEEGAMMSFNNEELMIHADIPSSTFYDYMKANPEFSERIDQLRNMPNMKAKQVILTSISKGSREDAKRRLERKGKEEFSKTPKKPLQKDNPLEGINFISS